MFVHRNDQIQAQFDQITRELASLHHQRADLENQRTRLNLLHQFQQQGVTRVDYIGFQPKSHHLSS